jgi:hypothetical protein
MHGFRARQERAVVRFPGTPGESPGGRAEALAPQGFPEHGWPATDRPIARGVRFSDICHNFRRESGRKSFKCGIPRGLRRAESGA